MENETFVPEIDTTVELPRVDGNEPQANMGASIAAVAERLGLDENAQEHIGRLWRPMRAASVPDEVVALLAKALHHDEDVANADAAGYLRGRNESIDVALNAKPADDSQVEETLFPRYAKRSVWD